MKNNIYVCYSFKSFSLVLIDSSQPASFDQIWKMSSDIIKRLKNAWVTLPITVRKGGSRKRSSSAVLAELGEMEEDLYFARYAKKK